MLRIFFLASFLGLASTAEADQARKVHLITEENPPINFLDKETGKISGAAHDMVMALFEQSGTDYRVELLPWHRGYRQALNSPNTCIYGINRTHDREDLFLWVGPLMESGWAFYGYDNVSRFDHITDLEDQIIVVKAGDAVATALSAARPDLHVLAVETDEMAVRLLHRGRAQFWLTGVVHVSRNAALAEVPIPELKMLWRKSVIYLGCSKDTPALFIEDLNATLPKLEDLRKSVIQKYWH